MCKAICISSLVHASKCKACVKKPNFGYKICWTSLIVVTKQCVLNVFVVLVPFDAFLMELYKVGKSGIL